MSRTGDWMQTFTGRKFWPLDPRADEIDIEDIAHALSMACRYGGHCLRFYSVAEHSILLSRALPAPLRLWGLLHDASEAYVLDVIRPLKPSLQGYREIEDRVIAQVAIKFDLDQQNGSMPDLVKAYDTRILVDEKNQNMAPGLVWGTDDQRPLGVNLQFWSPEQAKAEFLSEFASLSIATKAA